MTLKHKIRAYLLIFSFSIAFSYSLFLLFISYRGEDAIYNQLLSLAWQKRKTQNTLIHCPCNNGLVTIDKQPQKDWPIDLAEGFYEFDHIHLLHTKDQGQHWYLSIKSNDSPLDLRETELLTLIWVLLLITLVASLILSHALNSLIIKPIRRLVRRLLKSSIEANQKLEPRHTEIEYLEQLFLDNLSRLEDFLKREQQFTRTVSHELRTPISIMKTSLTLMDVYAPRHKLISLQEKMQRSVIKMEELTDIFLELSREENLRTHKKPIDITTVIKEVCEALDETTQWSITEHSPCSKTVSPRLIYSLFENIIRNINIHSRGSAYVSISAKRIYFVNQNRDNNKPHGSGLGLTIIDKICTVLEWDLLIHSTEYRFLVKIEFNDE